MNLNRFTSTGEAGGLSLVLIHLYVLALTPRLHYSEIALQLFENIALFVVCFIYTLVIGRRRSGPLTFWEYHLCTGCTGQVPGRNLVTPLLVYLEAWTVHLQP